MEICEGQANGNEGVDFSYLQALDAACPVDILPPQWGGTNTGADICLGGEESGLELSQHKPQEISGHVGYYFRI